MKDKRGVDRGKCSFEGCDCTDYFPPDGEAAFSCAYCGHFPVVHENRTAVANRAKSKSLLLDPPVEPAPPAQAPLAQVPAPAPAAEPMIVDQEEAREPALFPPAMVEGVEEKNKEPTEPAKVLVKLTPPLEEEEEERSTQEEIPAAEKKVVVEAEHPVAAPPVAAPVVAPVAVAAASSPPHLELAAVVAPQKHAPPQREEERKPEEESEAETQPEAAAPGPIVRAASMDAATRKACEEAMVPLRECIVCLDELPVTEMYTVNCPSSHRFCFGCMSRLISMCIKDNLPIICPAPNKSCTHILGEDEVRQVAANDPELPKELIDKYLEQQLLRGIQTIPGVCACPTAGCPNWVVPEDLRVKERCFCQGCKVSFCSLCKRVPYHYHCSCDQVFEFSERWMQWGLTGRSEYTKDKAQMQSQVKELEKKNAELKARFEAMLADEKYKAENGRHCPHCKRVIVKDSGCDSMVCGRDYHGGNVQDGCGKHFQWSKAKPYKSPAALSEADAAGLGSKKKYDDAVREYVHEGVACDHCKKEIKGLRFSCLNCPAFDLCEKCEVKATLEHPHDHIFSIISQATVVPDVAGAKALELKKPVVNVEDDEELAARLRLEEALEAAKGDVEEDTPAGSKRPRRDAAGRAKKRPRY